jgi:hypothetical protein
LTKLEKVIATANFKKLILDYLITEKCPSDYGLEDSLFCHHGVTCQKCWEEKIEEATK